VLEEGVAGYLEGGVDLQTVTCQQPGNWPSPLAYLPDASPSILEPVPLHVYLPILGKEALSCAFL